MAGLGHLIAVRLLVDNQPFLTIQTIASIVIRNCVCREDKLQYNFENAVEVASKKDKPYNNNIRTIHNA